jgi:hypothetical protein
VPNFIKKLVNGGILLKTEYAVLVGRKEKENKMKRKFMEGLRKFTAMFVLLQMVLVLFPAQAAMAEKDDKWSVDNVYIHNLETNVDIALTSGLVVDLTGFLTGKIALATDVTSNSQNGCVLFNLNSVPLEIPYSLPVSPGSTKVISSPVTITPGNHNLIVELYTNTNCTGGSKAESTLISFSATGNLIAPLVAPTLIAPANNAVVDGAEVTNQWSAVTGATSYIYQSCHDELCLDQRFLGEYTATEKIAYDVADSTFWWRVKAKNAIQEGPWSDTWKLTIENSNDIETLAAPTLLSPADNAVVNGDEVTNVWSEVTGATAYVYESYHDSALTNLRYTNQYTATEKTAYNVADSTFWWRVKAVNATTESAWSNVWKLTIDNDIPTTPTILHPVNEQYFNSQPILNSWTSSYDKDGIKEYRVEYIYDDGHTFAGGPYRTTTNTYRYHTPGLTEQGGVTIRVQAIDNNGNEGGWSEPVHYYYDWEAPTSSVDGLPQGTNSKSFNVNITADDNVALDYVELWYRKDYGSWMKYALANVASTHGMDMAYTLTSEFDPNETILFETNSDGYYEFFSIAVDKAGNIEQKNPNDSSFDPEAFTTVYTQEDNGGNPGNGDGGDGSGDGDGTGSENIIGEGETTLLATIVGTPTAAAVLGETTDEDEDQDVSSETTDNEEGVILGEEDEGGSGNQCPWWWIIIIVLAFVLSANYWLANKYRNNETLLKALMITPIAYGLLALVAHRALTEGVLLTGVCRYLWLIVALMVAAYYPAKTYLDKRTTQK